MNPFGISHKWMWRISFTIALVGCYFFGLCFTEVIVNGKMLFILPALTMFLANVWNFQSAGVARRKWLEEQGKNEREEDDDY